MQRTLVLNVVGLTQSLIGKHTPRISEFVHSGTCSQFPPVFPAVTCTAQSSYVTGRPVAEHGVVANGWYDREAAEVKFWKQSNKIVRGEKIWDQLKREIPEFSCAKLFWWYNMYAEVDWSITPRPMYPADGRKVFDVYTQPMSMREEIKSELGDFPFPTFWGPNASIPCTEWIAASAKWVEQRNQPTLNLVYLPHLDYGLQKYGPGAPEMVPELQHIDRVVGDLIDFFEEREVKVVLLSEYGISKVDKPVHLNREFRRRGWITIKDELGKEMIDCGASRVFAIADHQVAHIYINDTSLHADVLNMLEQQEGVEEVRLPECFGEQNADRIGNAATERAGDLIAVAQENAWFTYYYWESDTMAPDFARCVDIHRKIGYDPVELFFDPKLKFPKLSVLTFLAKKKLGFRAMMEVIPLDASLVKGSHGRDRVRAAEQPIFATRSTHLPVRRAEDVYERLLEIVRA